MRAAGALLAACFVLAGCGGGVSIETRPTHVGILAIELATGNRVEFAVPDTTWSPRAMASEVVLGQAYFVAAVRLARVDVANGGLTLVSDATRGMGPLPSNLVAVAVDPAQGRAFAYDVGIQGIMGIDLATGDRTIVSDATTGTGPAFNIGPAGMLYDAAGARLIVAAPAVPVGPSVFRHALVAVDPATGHRTILSDSATGTGPEFSFNGSFALAPDFAGGRALVHFHSTLVAVELATGNRALIYDGPPYLFTTRIGADPANSRVIEARHDGLRAIDLPTGNAAAVSNEAMGTGPVLADAACISTDLPAGRVIVAGRIFDE
jgi:hypothetical protein